MATLSGMIAYHEVSPDNVDAVLREGLKRTSRGDKGNDDAIMRTDQLLDELRPKKLKEAGWSRDDNLYAYVADGDQIIDITSGKWIPVNEYVARSEQSVLEVAVDPARCYVSDLDLYDELRTAVEQERDEADLRAIAARYFAAIQPLNSFDGAKIVRPEIMVTYDIEPHSLRRLS